MQNKRKTTKKGVSRSVVDRGRDATIVTFSSRGGGQSGESAEGNSRQLIGVNGSPWTQTGPGAYGTATIRLRLSNYFSDAIFAAYDYFRVKECETTFTWASSPEDGKPILGELFYYQDKDSSNVTNVLDIANRMSLSSVEFNNHRTRHVFTWQPYLVEKDSDTENPEKPDYIQPRSRWLNSASANQYLFGSLPIIVTVPQRSIYDSTPAINYRHRITIELKGQGSLQQGPQVAVIEVQGHDTQTNGQCESDDL